MLKKFNMLTKQSTGNCYILETNLNGIYTMVYLKIAFVITYLDRSLL